MRPRTLVLAIAAALLVGAAPAQAHGGHHHGHHQKPRAATAPSGFGTARWTSTRWRRI
jgi:hypothetical protein